jgi:acyl carrier protein
VYQLDRIDKVWQYDVSAEDKVVVGLDTGARAVVSAWHPFLVWDGRRVVERRADQVRRGDAVLGPNETAASSLPVRDVEVAFDTSYFHKGEQHRVRIDADLAWLCGYFLGDGSLGHHRRATTNKKGVTYEYAGLRLRFHDETVEVLGRVREVVARVFGIDPSRVDDGASPDTVEGWDSMGHLNLVCALEERFGISIDIADAMEMVNVAKIRELLLGYGVRSS